MNVFSKSFKVSSVSMGKRVSGDDFRSRVNFMFLGTNGIDSDFHSNIYKAITAREEKGLPLPWPINEMRFS